jgi:hypothetical protein
MKSSTRRRDIAATYNGVRSCGQVLLMKDLKPNFVESVASIGDGPHLGDPVADFDAMCDGLVVRDRGIPLVGHHPLVDTELMPPRVRSKGKKDELEWSAEGRHAQPRQA